MPTPCDRQDPNRLGLPFFIFTCASMEMKNGNHSTTRPPGSNVIWCRRCRGNACSWEDRRYPQLLVEPQSRILSIPKIDRPSMIITMITIRTIDRSMSSIDHGRSMTIDPTRSRKFGQLRVYQKMSRSVGPRHFLLGLNGRPGERRAFGFRVQSLRSCPRNNINSTW